MKRDRRRQETVHTSKEKLDVTGALGRGDLPRGIKWQQRGIRMPKRARGVVTLAPPRVKIPCQGQKSRHHRHSESVEPAGTRLNQSKNKPLGCIRPHPGSIRLVPLRVIRLFHRPRARPRAHRQALALLQLAGAPRSLTHPGASPGHETRFDRNRPGSCRRECRGRCPSYSCPCSRSRSRSSRTR